jgi:transposase-like protein
MRNGHRKREVQTTVGSLQVWYPRVVCECGGSVRLPLSLLGRYQRFFGDIDAQIEQYAQWGLSLRQMKGALSDMLGSEVGLARLNACVQGVRQPFAGILSSVPPILLLDGIWVTVLRPSAARCADRAGRMRNVKVRHKVVVLVALGVWPSGKWEVLDWHLASGEDYHSWETLLLRLEERGVYAQRGLRLIVHDGNAPLTAVLNQLYPHVPHQRCLFHKFRNLWQAIAVPDALDKTAARAFKRTLMQQLRATFYAPSQMQAIRRRDEFCRQWTTTQSSLCAILMRDWQDCVAFFAVHARFPDWPLSRLRTTSLLERLNRLLRRFFRAASAFHSDAGLLAALARILAPLRAI